MLLAGAVLLLWAGLHSVGTAVAASRGPRGLGEARAVLRQLGGEPGLAARRASLAALVARLGQERVAHGADAAAFSRRIEEAFAELGLDLTSSSEWNPVPKFKLPGAAAFERTFAGSGPVDRLVDAQATVESWPDEARVRSLSVTGQGAGRVAFTLEISAVRSSPRERS